MVDLEARVRFEPHQILDVRSNARGWSNNTKSARRSGRFDTKSKAVCLGKIAGELSIAGNVDPDDCNLKATCHADDGLIIGAF